jgi:hypothetical protein
MNEADGDADNLTEEEQIAVSEATQFGKRRSRRRYDNCNYVTESTADTNTTVSIESTSTRGDIVIDATTLSKQNYDE